MSRYLAVLLLTACVVPSSHAQTEAERAASPFGFSCCHQTTYSLSTYVEEMARAGLTWVRGFPTAGSICPERGRFDWTEPDRFLEAATRNGISANGLFIGIPEWMETDDVKLPVKDLEAWSQYVTAMVTRYKGRIKHWEVWNETPNFIGSGTAEDYARTVVASYDAAKAADPDCEVMLSIQSNNILWLQQVLEAGARGHYDAISVHPYEILDMVQRSGFEPVFMSVVPSLRKLLAAVDPERVNVPIWFTEVGQDVRDSELPQAAGLVKAFCLSIAQGVTRVDWFSGKDGDSGPMGLLRADGTRRPAWHAMRNLTQHLGPAPRYLGWVLLPEGVYGFGFQGPQGPVLAVWGPPNSQARLELGAVARLVDPLTGATTEASSCAVGAMPLLVLDPPGELLAEAAGNLNKPLRWRDDLDYSGATLAYWVAGEPNLERGLHQANPDAASSVVKANGVVARDCGKAAGQAFVLGPTFMCYTTEPITITVVARRNAANDNAGFNLKYESLTGIHGTGAWYTIPGNDRWYSQSWRITDAQFVGKWGYHFSLDSDVPTSYLLQSITVTRGQ